MRLGATSIVVTHDVVESLQIVDYLYFISDGGIVGQGTPDEVRRSTEPFVHQFVHAETDGPIPFHYPALPLAEDVGLQAPTVESTGLFPHREPRCLTARAAGSRALATAS